MAYTAKTNWTSVDGVSATDLNKIEQGIADITASALPAASYTAADVLTKIKTVDGTGSGLDADLVKGYVPVNKAGDTMTGPLTLGTQSGGTAANTWSERFNFNYRDAAGVLQAGYIQMDPSGEIYITDGTRKIWHTGQLRDNAGTLEFFSGGIWKAVGGVKSIQRGRTSVPAGVTTNVTIASVNTAKSSIRATGLISAGFGNSIASGSIAMELTTATNIAISNSDASHSFDISWEVIEYY